MKKVLLTAVIMALMAFSVAGFDYFIYQTNVQPGEERLILNSVNGSAIEVKVPFGFNITNTTGGANQTRNNLTWATGGNFTVKSPANCSSGDRFEVEFWEGGIKQATGVYVCIEDNKIINSKIEYGHGDANYLTEDFISNESTTLFNLIRVFNIGSYISVDDIAENVSLTCTFEDDLPIRTYGHTTNISFVEGGIEADFFWSEIPDGYWFRISVLSQDLLDRAVGDKYTVNCTSVEYFFDQQRVVASFDNYTLHLRNVTPFNITIDFLPEDTSKMKYTITNQENYTVYDVFFVRSLDGVLEHEQIPVLESGQEAVYYVDRTSEVNLTVFFIPAWYKNSRNPIYYTQEAEYLLGDVPVISNFPNIVFQEDTNHTGLDLDDYVFDFDTADSALNWTVTQDANLIIEINTSTHLVAFIPAANFEGIVSVNFTVIDPENNSAVVFPNVTVLGVNDPPVIIPAIPDQYLGANASSYLLNLSAFESDVDDGPANLTWTVTGSDAKVVNISVNNTGRNANISPAQGLTALDAVTFILSDNKGLEDSQEVVIRLNMSLSLVKGFNLISVPHLKNLSVVKVLLPLTFNNTFGCGRDESAPLDCNITDGDFNGTWISIQTYDAVSGTFLFFDPSDYHPTVPGSQEFEVLSPTRGYWIEVTANKTLPLEYDSES